MTTRERILRVLEMRGPMTKRALATELNLSVDAIRSATKDMKEDKEIHICGWVFESLTGKGPPSSLIKLGDDIDEPVPPSSEIPRIKRSQDYYGVSSIFDIGIDRRVDVISILKKNLPGPKHSVDGQTFGSYTGGSSKGSRKAER